MIQQFLLAHGTFDTKKDQPEAKYAGINWKQIAELVEHPQAVEKAKADFIIPSFYREHDGRVHEVQRERGQFGMLALDIDSGSPTIDQVIEAVQKVAGSVSMLVYSSAGASEEKRKWRVLIPIKEPISGLEYMDSQTVLFDMLDGIQADHALARPGQPIYLPNVPPERRTEAGEPIFYQSRIVRAGVLDLLNSAIWDGVEVKREREAIMLEEIRQEREMRKQALAARKAEGEVSPVEEFNKQNTVADMLERYGYQKGPRGSWRSPLQSSDTFATKDFGDYWVSQSGSDTDAGLGAKKDEFCWGDAFDLFRYFEHGNDQTAAVRAYGREIRPEINRAAEINREIEEGSPFAPVEVDPEDPEEIRGGWFDWTYLKSRGVFRNIQTGEECKADAFNLAFGREVPDMPASNGRTYRPTASKYLLNELQVRQAYDVLYWPKAAKFGMFFEHDQITYVNSYLPNRVPKADPNWQQHSAWKTVLAHLQQILPDDWEILVKWMAHNVQHPGEKILWAPIIKGVQGDGKTTIYRVMMAVMGEKNVREISTQELTSEFNAWAEGACVAVLEEIRIKGHNRHDAMNKLKPVVSNMTVSVVRKGRDGRNIPNCTNYMALTNHEDALALDADDRRWGVFFTKYENREQLLAETDDAYWSRLHSAYQDHPAVIRGWLESISLTGFNCMAAPYITKAKAKMILLAKGETEAAVEEAIAMGGYGITKEVVAADCLNDAIRNAGNHTLQTTILYKIMTSLGYEKMETVFKWKGKSRRLYVHKSKPNWMAPDELARAEMRELLDGTGDELAVPF